MPTIIHLERDLDHNTSLCFPIAAKNLLLYTTLTMRVASQAKHRAAKNILSPPKTMRVLDRSTNIEQLRYEISAIESENQLLRLLLSSSSDPILITSSKAKILFVNPAWERLTGYSLSEVEGKTPRIFSSGKTAKKVYRQLWTALTNGVSFTTEEIINKDKQGQEYQIHSSFFPVTNHKKLELYVQLQHDITERKRLERSLHYHTLITEHVAEGVCLIRITDGVIVYTNPKFEKMFGYTSGELTDKPFSFLCFAKDEKTAKKIAQKILQTLRKQETTIYETRSIRKDRTSLWCKVTVSQFNHPEFGDVWIAIHEDISEFKRLEELRREFLSAVAHELKTPITVLKLITQSQMEKAKKLAQKNISEDEFLLIDRELSRLTRLIDDLLDSSRMESGKWQMNFVPTNLSRLTNDVVNKMRLFAKNHKIILHEIANIFVIADNQRLEQVLYNLISNAIKYSPEKTTITVDMQVKKKLVIVSITDQGIGISKEKQELIFDRFYQVKSAHPNGFGLGLYISKEIITRHKGKIWLKSKEKRGSTFYFSLPLTKE